MEHNQCKYMQVLIKSYQINLFPKEAVDKSNIYCLYLPIGWWNLPYLLHSADTQGEAEVRDSEKQCYGDGMWGSKRLKLGCMMNLIMFVQFLEQPTLFSLWLSAMVSLLADCLCRCRFGECILRLVLSIGSVEFWWDRTRIASFFPDACSLLDIFESQITECWEGL